MRQVVNVFWLLVGLVALVLAIHDLVHIALFLFGY